VADDYSIENVFQETVQRATEANPKENGDYIGDDGLLYCGMCNTRKQYRMEFPIRGKAETIVPVTCRCKRERLEAEERERKENARMERIANLKRASMMDGQLSRATFESANITNDNREPMEICRRYAEKFDEMYKNHQGLLLMGDVGTGKTFAAACIANYLIEHGIPCVMTSFVRLVALTRPYDGDDGNDMIESMLESPLLVIDDLGAQRDTSYANERVYDFIDRRCQAESPMIVTTNITDAKELSSADRITDRRIYDRILQTCTPITFAGPSRRLEEARTRMVGLKNKLGIE
jgi:DNA replication protein DnaC